MMRRTAWLPAVLIMLGMAGAEMIAAAESPRLQLASGLFYERYDGKAPVSGTMLVGLQLGLADHDFDPDQVGVLLPNEVLGRTICVAITSQDGRYAARNLYNVPSTASRDALLVTRPKNPVQLRQYKAGEIAVTARASDECGPAGVGPLIPVRLGPDRVANGGRTGSVTALIAFINEDPERISFRLIKGRDIVAESQPCITSLSTTRIAYTSRCDVSVPGGLADGKYDIELTINGSFKPQTERYSVYLARP